MFPVNGSTAVTYKLPTRTGLGYPPDQVNI